MMIKFRCNHLSAALKHDTNVFPLNVVRFHSWIHFSMKMTTESALLLPLTMDERMLWQTWLTASMAALMRLQLILRVFSLTNWQPSTSGFLRRTPAYHMPASKPALFRITRILLKARWRRRSSCSAIQQIQSQTLSPLMLPCTDVSASSVID